MDNQQLEQLTESVIKGLQAGRIVDRETHEIHHRWLKQEIERRAKCDARRSKIIDTVFGSLVVAAAIGILSGIGFLIRSGLSHLLENAAK